MKVDIGISEANRKKVVEILNSVLADEFTLYTKTRNYHWNIVVSQFNELHKFLELQYQELEIIMDDVAERARIIGGHAIGTLSEIKERTSLKEHPGEYPVASKMIENLLHDHETVAKELRTTQAECDKKYEDVGTSDFLTGILQQHEKMAWMLRSTIDGQSASQTLSS